jgi:hypothetical protein
MRRTFAIRVLLAGLVSALSGGAAADDGRIELNSAAVALRGGYPLELQRGSYVLTGNLDAGPAGFAVAILAQDAGLTSIDLNGFEIRGDVFLVGSLELPSSAMLRNGAIFGYVALYQTHAIVRDLEMRGGVFGSIGSASDPEGSALLLLDNRLLELEGTVGPADLGGPTVASGNLLSGIRLEVVEGGAVVLDASVRDFLGGAGVVAAAPVLFAGNTVASNSAEGVYVDNVAPNATCRSPSLVLGNTLYQNAAAQLRFDGCCGDGYVANAITSPVAGQTVTGCAGADMAPNLCNGGACP